MHVAFYSCSVGCPMFPSVFPCRYRDGKRFYLCSVKFPLIPLDSPFRSLIPFLFCRISLASAGSPLSFFDCMSVPSDFLYFCRIPLAFCVFPIFVPSDFLCFRWISLVESLISFLFGRISPVGFRTQIIKLCEQLPECLAPCDDFVIDPLIFV